MLSDKTITDLCIMPPAKFDEVRFRALEAVRLLNYGIHLEEGLDTPVRPDYDQLRELSMVKWTDEEVDAWQPMIAPFSPRLIRERVYRNADEFAHQSANDPVADTLKIISSGLTSYGYDVTLADEFKVFTNVHSAVIDPKRLDERCLVDVKAQLDPMTGERFVLMPPNSYLLGHTIEYFRIPRDVMVVCVGKSTYARSGAIVNTTPIEPGFEGNVVIEISNSTNLPARVYAGEGISQFMFFRGDRPCLTSYGDRAGKYQGQTGLTMAKV